VQSLRRGFATAVQRTTARVANILHITVVAISAGRDVELLGGFGGLSC